MKKVKTIGIDARLYGSIGKGLGRYIKEVVDRIIETDKENNYVIFLCKDNFDEFNIVNESVKKILVNARWYTITEQIILPWIIWKEKIDFMHFPHFNVPVFNFRPFIVTIHDLILIKHPTQRATTLSPFIYKIKNFAYRIVIKLAAIRAKKIITVSEYTKNDIINVLKVKAEKIIITYEGVSKKFVQCDLSKQEVILLKYKINKPFILYVGNAYPHKNLEGLIDAFFELLNKRKELKLVLVGKEDYFYKRVKEYSKDNENIIFPGYVPDEELCVVYKNAEAYVFPSLFEGFGLPPLEAMIQGCPVVSSNKTCLPEILGNAALYFNPDDEKDVIEKIDNIIFNDDLKEKFVKQGHEQIKKYNWDDCAKDTFDLYKKYIS